MDVLTPTRDFITMPPIVSLNADERRIVRVGLRMVRNPLIELAYRVHFHEMSSRRPGFFVAVFVEPEAPARPIPRWAARGFDGQRIELVLTNDGNAHLKISDVEVTARRGSVMPVNLQVLLHLLPGQTHIWRFKFPHKSGTGEKLVISAVSDGERLETELLISASRGQAQ